MKILKAFLVYLAIFAVTIAVFWFFTSQTDGLGFSVFYVWGVIPVATFACSIGVGMSDWKYRWMFIPVFGALFMLVPYATFDLGAVLNGSNIEPPSIQMFLIGTALSAGGMGLAELIKFIRDKRGDDSFY